MKFLRKKLNSKVGLPPGYLSYYGEEEKHQTGVRVIQYTKDSFEEILLQPDFDLSNLTTENKITWIDIVGFSDPEFIKKIGVHFDIHDMVIEDVFHTDHIPKFDEGEDYNLILLKSFINDSVESKASHVALLHKENLIISFREDPNDIILPKIDRIKNSIGRTRRKKADYLLFVLLDTFIDTYYAYFEKLRESTSALESKLLIETSENYIQEIYNLNNELTNLHKNLFPLKVTITELVTDGAVLISEDNLKYFSDSKDHVNELIEYYHSFGEIIKSLISLNESNQNNNTNRVMKVLTIIATIFIPLSFMAGVFGMNFENMPELKLEYGYYYSLILMLITGLGILVFMKIKKWF